MDERTPQGKIGRLPHDIRERLNLRLLDHEPAKTVLAWLNSLPEQQRICREMFDGEEVSAKNLSDWKVGGWRKWQARRERVDGIKSLSAFARQMAEASGTALTDAAAAIAGGNILTMLESMEAGDSVALIKSLAALREGDLEREKMTLKRRDAALKEEALTLARDQFHWRAAGELLKWGRSPEAQAILGSQDADPAKLERLVHLMFGDRPEKEVPADA